MKKFEGTGVALVTPFKNSKIDFKALKKVVEHVINGGVDYLVCLGSTGEAGLLSEDEQREVLDFIISVNNGRKPLVAGNFGGSSTQQISKKIQNYDFKGIDAILCSCPAYVKPSQKGLIAHFDQLAESSPIAIILYNVPSRTSVNMSWETTLDLASKHKNIIGIKEASNDLHQCAKIVNHSEPDFLLLSGDDEMTLPILNLGGKGVISVAANAFPTEFSGMVKAALKGEAENALSAHQLLLDLHQWLYIEGNPTGIKAALEFLGICTREVRLPLVEMSSNNYKPLVKEIEKIRSL